MPDTPLTGILEDFRKYRPGNHREFLQWVRSAAVQFGIKNLALEESESAGNPPLNASCEYLAN